MKNILLAAMLALAFVAATTRADLAPPYEIGEQVADFKLQNVDGSMVTLSDYAGTGGVVVIFTCNTCPYSQLYEDRIIQLHKSYSAQGFPVLAINPNDPLQKVGDSFEMMKKRSADKGFPFAYVLDDQQEVYPRFGATNTPQVFLLDEVLKLRYIGAIDDNPRNAEDVQQMYAKNAIDALLSGKDPSPTRTKAIGCGIKPKKKS